VVHGEEGHAEVLAILLVPAQVGEGHRRPTVGQCAHHPVLRRELGVQEQKVLGRRHADDQAALVPTGRTGAAQDRLVGESVGTGRLDVEDLESGTVTRLGGQPALKDGGHLFRVALADIGHEAAV
jgi:hypothetical protein